MVHGLCVYFDDAIEIRLDRLRGCWYQFVQWVNVQEGNNPFLHLKKTDRVSSTNFRSHSAWSVKLDEWLEAGAPKAFDAYLEKAQKHLAREIEKTKAR